MDTIGTALGHAHIYFTEERPVLVWAACALVGLCIVVFLLRKYRAMYSRRILKRIFPENDIQRLLETENISSYDIEKRAMKKNNNYDLLNDEDRIELWRSIACNELHKRAKLGREIWYEYFNVRFPIFVG